MTRNRKRVCHYVEALEARDVPAGNLAWPIAGTPAILSNIRPIH